MALIEANALARLRLGTADDLIDGVLRAGDKVLLYARPKVGKTILAQQIARSLVGPHDLFERYAVRRRRRVLYIAGEGDVGELQAYADAMELALPILGDEGWLWYWSLPEEGLDQPGGARALYAVVDEIKESTGSYPDCVIADPAQFLMTGRLTEDQPVRAFLRPFNVLQSRTRTEDWPGPAIVVLHHTHRPKRDKEGEVVDEEGRDYMGSQAWEAWYKTAIHAERRADKSVSIRVVDYRVPIQLSEMRLTLVEERPLLFVPFIDGLTPTAQTALWATRTMGPMTSRELRERCWTLAPRSHTAVDKALSTLVERGLVQAAGSPRRYSFERLPEIKIRSDAEGNLD